MNKFIARGQGGGSVWQRAYSDLSSTELTFVSQASPIPFRSADRFLGRNADTENDRRCGTE